MVMVVVVRGYTSDSESMSKGVSEGVYCQSVHESDTVKTMSTTSTYV